jgi:cardiolipin synthase
VGQIQSVFADNWIQTRSEVLHGSNYFPELKPAGQVAAQCFRSGPRDGAENAAMAYLLSIAAARQSIRLAHAYFVPDHLLLEALLEARRRGVRVEVIVPSKTDHFLVQKASRSSWGKLLDAGVELYEYQPTLYHCKIMIVDDVWITAGSINFDERSFRMNDEANINVLNRDLAAKLIESYEADKKLSKQVTKGHFKKRNWFGRLFESVGGLFQSEL